MTIDCFSDFLQLILPPVFADAHLAKLIEGIDEVREVIERPADQGEAEDDIVAGLVGLSFFGRRFDDKGMGCIGILRHHLCIRRRRGFEDIGVNAFFFQDAVSTVAFPEGTDDLAEGVSEASPQGRPLVGRQQYYLFCGQRK